MSSIKRSAKGVEVLQLSHVESQPFYSLERQQSYTCCVLRRPSKSMTNYLEEKTDKDCTFEGWQDRFCCSRWTRLNQYQQIFMKWTRFTPPPPFNTFSWKKLIIKSWPGDDLPLFLSIRYDKEAKQLPAETQDCRVSLLIFSSLNSRYF